MVEAALKLPNHMIIKPLIDVVIAIQGDEIVG